MKRVFAILIILVILISLFTNVHATPVLNCTYWYSDSDWMGNWWTSPNIYRCKFGSDSDFIFYEAFNHARAQWIAAGRDSNLVTVSTNADIKVYGGTREDIYTYTGVNVSSSYSGLTVSSSYFDCYLNYQGSTKTLRKMVSANIYIINMNYTNNGTLKYKSTSTHELGHAFGWYGHSGNSDDIMYHTTTTVTSLTNRDKNHLCQTFY